MTARSHTTVFGSSDGVNWIELGEGSSITINLGVIKPLDYYRFELIGLNYLDVSNIEMFEAVILEEDIIKDETNANFTLYPLKFLPVLGYNSVNKRSVITDSTFTVPFGRPGHSSDIVDKQYVDNLTGLVTGEGLVRGNNGLNN